MRMPSKRGMKFLNLAAVTALSIGGATCARAAIVNGGFEDYPDFTGYNTLGSTSVQASDFHAPVDGNQQAFLATAPTDGGAPQTATQIETFLNLSAGTLATTLHATNGSAISQTFTATDGQVLTIHFDFVTNEQNGVPVTFDQELAQAPVINNDFAFLTLQNGAGPVSLTKLADTLSPMVPTNLLDGVNSFAPAETGYLTYMTTLSAGTYTLGLGVVNVNDTLNASGLLADAIDLSGGNQGGGGSSVPLPAALLVMPLGAAVAGLFGKRFRQSR